MSIKESRLEAKLAQCLPRGGKLAEAMRYSVFAGGKRFRPMLCLATAKALGCPENKVLSFACAVEMIHTFTLIHDDLPAMDNADSRRGKPTCHKKFGEALAILAGDALNTLAFKIISNYPRVCRELADALLEVVEGQAADIRSEGKKLSLKELTAIHRQKTGALLKVCVKGSALICNASPKQIKALVNYAGHLGLAFQIADDILDATATRKKLGKPVRSDLKKGFPYLLGLEKSKALAEAEMKKALSALCGFDRKANRLRKIARFAVARKR